MIVDVMYDLRSNRDVKNHFQLEFKNHFNNHVIMLSSIVNKSHSANHTRAAKQKKAATLKCGSRTYVV